MRKEKMATSREGYGGKPPSANLAMYDWRRFGHLAVALILAVPTLIPDSLWQRHRGDTTLGDRGTPGNTAHSGSHASTGSAPLSLRIWPTGLPDLGEHPFRDTLGVRG